MSNGQQQITAEQQVILLKAELFDVSKAAQNLQANVNELSGALQQIVEISGIAPNENGQVQLVDLVEYLRDHFDPAAQDDHAAE